MLEKNIKRIQYIIPLLSEQCRRAACKTATWVQFYKYVSYPTERKHTDRKIRIFVSPEVDVVINSYGGSMTTALEDWIRPYRKINMEYGDGKAEWFSMMKHAPYPPISTNRRLRLVYVFGDPILSVLSVFRRRTAVSHYTAVSSSGPLYKTPAMRFKMRSLKAYLASDLGAFPIRQHFHNWRKEPTQHPILFIRAETIWDNLEVLQSFLGLPAEAMDCFPEKKERQSLYEILKLSPSEREKLNRLYGEFAEEIKRMPDAEIRPADWFA